MSFETHFSLQKKFFSRSHYLTVAQRKIKVYEFSFIHICMWMNFGVYINKMRLSSTLVGIETILRYLYVSLTSKSEANFRIIFCVCLCGVTRLFCFILFVRASCENEWKELNDILYDDRTQI